MCALLGLAWLSWFGREGAGGGRYPTPQASQPAQPATHTPMYSRLFVCCCFTYIYYICSTSHRQTDRQTSIDRSISVYSLSLSLSLYIVLVLVACTLSHHHHTTRAVRVYVCVCIWLPFEQCFRHPDNRPHNDIICRGQTTGAHRHHSNAPRHALLGAGHGVLCVCIGVSCCEAAVRGGRVEIRAVPPPARPLAATRAAGRQACRRQARTFPPCCCCCCNITTMNDCATRTLYDAHHWCAAARWPAHQAPRHTRHICILCVYIYIQYNRTHTTLAAATSRHQHHLPRRRSRPTISAQYYRIIIRRHVIEYVGTWMEHHQSQMEEKGAAAAEANVMYDGSPIYI